ncbi:hypothetical protein TELCIR_08667 [Teladorsagia circumcincta]|uniref:Reverse transcriptase domain-containing protein n=1 Tax=Teladorsagia circumcincta TaxID=45464 RepID=A0A2G9UIF2_TELCI|nr:hypothetical protein TELCIR_08667 [Teladorsagia circumcincta]
MVLDHLLDVVYNDIVLFSNSITEAETMLNELNEAGSRIGLRVNRRKTQFMKNSWCEEHHMTINGLQILETNSYVYLGRSINMNNDLKEELDRRKRAGWTEIKDMKAPRNGSQNKIELPNSANMQQPQHPSTAERSECAEGFFGEMLGNLPTGTIVTKKALATFQVNLTSAQNSPQSLSSSWPDAHSFTSSFELKRFELNRTGKRDFLLRIAFGVQEKQKRKPLVKKVVLLTQKAEQPQCYRYASPFTVSSTSSAVRRVSRPAEQWKPQSTAQFPMPEASQVQDLFDTAQMTAF